MTPLAMLITKQLTLPKKRRFFTDHCGLLPLMSDVHCFEVSEVFAAARTLVLGPAAEIEDLEDRGRYISDRIQKVSEYTSFLPAPNTWIEWTNELGGRTGVLLREDKGGFCQIRIAENIADRRDFHSSGGIYRMALGGGYGDALRFQSTVTLDEQARLSLCSLLITLNGILAMINTPRIIGRRQHMPHRGLERKLVAASGIVGKFPLNAWTEIKLEVTAPKDASDSASVEAHYTGARALHFCRAHLRMRLGQLEIVRSHWRGDGSLGIKQSRYKLSSKNQTAA